MTSALDRAFSELKAAGAKGLPSVETVKKAPNKSKWHGLKSDGNEWEMIKNSEDSYNNRC
jgi:hypothetical protein